MGRPSNPGWKPVTMKLPDDVVEQLRQRAHEQGTTIGKVASQAIKVGLGMEAAEDHHELLARLEKARRRFWGTERAFVGAISSIAGESLPSTSFRR